MQGLSKGIEIYQRVNVQAGTESYPCPQKV